MSVSESGHAESGTDPVAPPGVDTTVPSVARVYDYGLGGKNNFEVDRIAAENLVKLFPGSSELAVMNRRFLQRGVRFLAGEAGIRQFIDVGSGLPTAGNVHEIAHEVDPQAHVVYVDNDPSALIHGRALLADYKTTVVIAGDATEPTSILDDPETQRLIDFDQPFAVLMAGLLHHLSDEQDPPGIARAFTERMPSGSYLLVSNFLDDDNPRAKELEQRLVAHLGSGWFRTWAEQRAYFEGLEMVAPGLVYANDWRPDRNTPANDPWHTFYCGGIGRKP